MKPIYDMYTMKWRVKGLGRFDSLQEALEAIKKSKKTTTLTLRINTEVAEKLQDLAISRNCSVSEVVRTLIEKEILKY